MITLKTLAQATEQEVFDQVARHLLTQLERSWFAGRCAYRGNHDMKCAAGCLIGDSEYEGTMEGQNWRDLVGRRYAVPPMHELLISRLQSTHDCIEPCDWRRRLKAVATEFKLSTAVIDELKQPL
jgi:hypothetical protein